MMSIDSDPVRLSTPATLEVSLERWERLQDLVGAREDSVPAELRAELAKLAFFELADCEARFRAIVAGVANTEGLPITAEWEQAIGVAPPWGLQSALHAFFVHGVRNAAAHGWEGREARAALGKPEALRLRFSAEFEAGVLKLSLEDDGRGLKREVLEERARLAGLLPEAARGKLSLEALIALASEAGMSATAKPTLLSGRGVGLAAVRSAFGPSAKVGLELSSLGGTRLFASLPLAMFAQSVELHSGRSAPSVCRPSPRGESRVFRRLDEAFGRMADPSLAKWLAEHPIAYGTVIAGRLAVWDR